MVENVTFLLSKSPFTAEAVICTLWHQSVKYFKLHFPYETKIFKYISPFSTCVFKTNFTNYGIAFVVANDCALSSWEGSYWCVDSDRHCPTCSSPGSHSAVWTLSIGTLSSIQSISANFPPLAGNLVQQQELNDPLRYYGFSKPTGNAHSHTKHNVYLARRTTSCAPGSRKQTLMCTNILLQLQAAAEKSSREQIVWIERHTRRMSNKRQWWPHSWRDLSWILLKIQ